MCSTSLQGHCMQAGPADGEERITINVGGVRHETYRCTLTSMPGTRLANLVSDNCAVPNKDTSEFFFDRNADAFSHILNYYRTGKLHYPTGLCGPLFEEELAYWGISETDVEPCCWTNFKRHRDAEEALAQFEPDEQPPDYNTAVDGQEGLQTQNVCRSKVWALFDDPHSSVPAMIIAIVSLLFILVSIAGFSLVRIEQLQRTIDYDNYTGLEMDEDHNQAVDLFLVELTCVIWFTFEFLVRIICCPDKRRFVRNILNIIDFLAFLPFYVGLCLQAMYGLTLLAFLARGFRLLRVFKMAWHLAGARALVHTLRASAGQLFLLGVPLSVAILILSPLVYYAESNAYESSFDSIPTAFWWAVVTMTTVGYGDVVPVTWPGKVIASLCALTGVLSIAMPIPILVNNFAKYYALTEAKHRRPVKGRTYNGLPRVDSAPVWTQS
ncbi:hypothetical protein ACEWY4_010775 [Coilia grayii]|uniref:BTB domain-containing protein n=1 Tax=Coilia grayii TaxID=363190 RepID=A0ABD1K2W6_9TELE